MSVKLYGTRWCPDCIRAKRILRKCGTPFEDVNIDSDPTGAELVMALNRGYRSVPTIVFPDGSTLTEPKGRELLDKLRDLGLASS